MAITRAGHYLSSPHWGAWWGAVSSFLADIKHHPVMGNWECHILPGIPTVSGGISASNYVAETERRGRRKERERGGSIRSGRGDKGKQGTDRRG